MRNGLPRPFQVQGTLVLLVMLSASLGLLQLGLLAPRPCEMLSSGIIALLGITLLGATLGVPVGYALDREIGSWIGGILGAGLFHFGFLVVDAVRCLASVQIRVAG